MQNRLLAALPAAEFDRLAPHLKPVELALKQVLHQPNQPLEFVYFPTDGMISLITRMQDGSAIETGTVGNEGLVGIPVFLRAERMPVEAFCQIPGSAMRMTSATFQREVTPDLALYRLLQRYTQALFNQSAQSAACNRLHTIEARFCRWMLMTRDRVNDDQFPMTQEFLAEMLGVQRSSVNLIAATIQRAGLIEYRRGQMTILDRAGMEEVACECYAVIREEFDRLVRGSQP